MCAIFSVFSALPLARILLCELCVAQLMLWRILWALSKTEAANPTQLETAIASVCSPFGTLEQRSSNFFRAFSPESAQIVRSHPEPLDTCFAVDSLSSRVFLKTSKFPNRVTFSGYFGRSGFPPACSQVLRVLCLRPSLPARPAQLSYGLAEGYVRAGSGASPGRARPFVIWTLPVLRSRTCLSTENVRSM
jgi:hypothetical protein